MKMQIATVDRVPVRIITVSKIHGCKPFQHVRPKCGDDRPPITINHHAHAFASVCDITWVKMYGGEFAAHSVEPLRKRV
jgi:hypothetical protein